MKNIEEYNKEDISAINKELKYFKNGISYLEATSKECFNWGGLSICDCCGKKICENGFLVWMIHSYVCKDCLKKIQDYKLNEADKEIQQYETDPTTYIWYLYHFDHNLAKEVDAIQRKQYENFEIVEI